MDIHPPGSRRPAAGRRVKPTTNTAPASQGGGFLHGQPPEQKKKQARSSHPAAVLGRETPRFRQMCPPRRAVCFLAPFPASQGRGACADNRPNRRESGRVPQPPPAGKRPASGKCARPVARPVFPPHPPLRTRRRLRADKPPNREALPRRSHSPLFARPAVGIWRISSFFHTFARRLCYNRGEREGRRRACGGRRNCRGRNCCNFPGGTRF